MRISLGELPVNGLVIKDSLPVDSLNQRMAEGRDNEIIFTAVSVDLLVTGAKGGALINGKTIGTCRQPCSLCAETIEHQVEATIDFFLKPRADESDGVEADDLGIIYYDDDSVDIEDLIQESLILQLSPYWHPERDQNGCCQMCGIHTGEKLNCEERTNTAPVLGELFKKAGIK